MRLFAVIVLTVSLSSCFSRHQIGTGLEGTPVPSIDLLLMDSTTTFNTRDLSKGRPVILFYFSPDCPYCRAQTEAIVENMQSLRDVQFCLLTYSEFKMTKSYYKEYGLEKYPNVVVGRDYRDFFSPYFKAYEVPYLVIYDTKGRLKEILVGNVKAKVIEEIIRG